MFEADHAVVGGEGEQPQALLSITPTEVHSSRRRRKVVTEQCSSAARSYPQPKTRDLHQPVGDNGVADPGLETAQRVPVLALGQGREELIAEGSGRGARWDGRHGSLGDHEA